MRTRKLKAVFLRVVGILALLLLAAMAIHPALALRLAFLGILSLLLVGGGIYLARNWRVPAGWGDWLAIVTGGLTIWWMLWNPRLLLPFPVQISCRILGIALSTIAAVAFYRSLPQLIHKASFLFPLVPIVLSILIPLGPERWEVDPLHPWEPRFLGKLLLVRAGEGLILVYDFPRKVLLSTHGFHPYATLASTFAFGPLDVDPLLLDLGLPGWLLTVAVLNSEREVEIATIHSSGMRDRDSYTMEEGQHISAITPGPEDTFLLVYLDQDRNAWLRRMDARWKPLADPIPLEGFGDAITVARKGGKLAYVMKSGREVMVVDPLTGDLLRLDLSREISEAGGGEKTYIHSLSFSPDGKELALGLSWKGGFDCPGLVWRVDLEGRVLARLLPPTPAKLGNDLFVSILAYAPDGKRLAAEVSGHPGRLAVIDVASGRVRDLPRGNLGFNGAVFSSDGRYLVATKYDAIYVWKLNG